MRVPDVFEFSGLGINIPFSAQTAGGALATQAVTSSTDWVKVISQTTDSINKAIDTGASAYATKILSKAPVIIPAPVYQQQAGPPQAAPLFGSIDMTTAILVGGGALLVLGLAFIVTR